MQTMKGAIKVKALHEKLKDVYEDAKMLNMQTKMDNRKIGQAINHIRAAMQMLEQAKNENIS